MADRPDGSITHWIQDIKDGNRDAAQSLWERYFTRLVNHARNEMRGANRRVSDEEDVAQSVFATFCRAAENGRYPDLSDRDSLWRLLIKMTVDKSIDHRRKASAKKRGGANVRGESAFRPSSQDESNAMAEVIGDEPTPEFVAVMSEQVTALLELLDRDDLKKLAIAKLEGYTNKEIAERENCSERTIERRLNLIRTRCNENYFG